jgi:hypothetical protein
VRDAVHRAEGPDQIGLSAAAGEHVQQEGVVYVKGRKVRIESMTPVPVQVDGEPAGMTPVEIDLLPCRYLLSSQSVIIGGNRKDAETRRRREERLFHLIFFAWKVEWNGPSFHCS